MNDYRTVLAEDFTGAYWEVLKTYIAGHRVSNLFALAAHR